MDRPIYDVYHKLVSEENISSKYRSRDVVPTAMPRSDAIHSRFRWRDDGSQIMMMVVVMMIMMIELPWWEFSSDSHYRSTNPANIRSDRFATFRTEEEVSESSILCYFCLDLMVHEPLIVYIVVVI